MAITISDTEPRVQYTASSGQTAFSVPFEFFTVADIKVFNGTTALSYNASPSSASQYSVTGAGVSGGGSITLGGGATLNDVITIFRDLGIARSTDFPTSGAFQIDSLNTELDKIIAMIQQVERDLKFSPRAAATTANTFNITFPNLIANKVLNVNSAGNGLEFGQDITDITTIAGIASNVSTVSGIASNVTTVANVHANVTTVANNINSVNTVAADIAKVITVANDLAEAVSEVETVADDLNEATSEIDTVASSITNVDAVGTNIANVNTVAGISSNVTTVAGNNANVSTVAGISSNVSTVAGISSDVTSVANDATDIGTVATNIGNVNTVAGISGNVTTVAGISSNVTSVANNSSNINSVAGNNSNISTVAGVSSDVTTVAGISSDVQAVENIASNVTTVAGMSTAINTANSNSSNINTVAGAITNVNNVGGSIANVNTVAGNLSGVNSFGERYRVSSSAPTTSLDVGDLYYDTATDAMKVYGSSGWQNAGSSVNGTSQRYNYTATSGQTTFTGADNNGNTLTYDAGFIDVYLNGSKLLNGTDVTVTSGSSVVLASGATTGDVVDIVAYGTFTVASLNADNLTSGTVPSARVSGAYTGITQTGTLTSFTSTGIDDNATSTAIQINSNEQVILYGGQVQANNNTSNITYSGGNNSNAGANLTLFGGSHASTPNVARFRSSATEVMRITLAGDLLVGTTSVNPGIGNANTGFSVTKAGGQVGHIAISQNGNYSANFNRNTSDGTIVQFSKQGTAVGNIGVKDGNNLTIDSTGTNHCGIEFDGGSYIPRRNSATADNLIDLGTSSTRYAHLYLGGGVFLGGTGTANELDDYEEGTWTPTLTNETTAVYSNQTGWYRKIGNTVFIYFSVSLSSKGDISGSYTRIGSLPFTGSPTTRYGSGQIHAYRLGSSAHIQGIEFGGGIGTSCWIMTGGGSTSGYLNTSFVADNTFFEGFGMYRTA